MSIKKVLAALGLVCVVAPAALAASMMMNRGNAGSPDQSHQGVIDAMLSSLQEMIEGSRDVGKGKIPQGAGAGPGSGSLPVRSADVLVPNLDHLKNLDMGGTEGPLGDVAAASLPAGAGGAAGGSVGTQERGAGQNASPSPVGLSTFSGHGSSGSNLGGAGLGNALGGPGGASGSGGLGGPSITDRALDVEPILPAADVDTITGGETIAALPLPASVWMLMASMIGLAFIGFRRRSLSS